MGLPYRYISMSRRKTSSVLSSLASPDAPPEWLSVEDSVAARFGESRREHGRLLDVFLGLEDDHVAGLPVVQLSGPRGSGKTVILREALTRHIDCTVWIDCAAIVSPAALMTSILRKLALLSKSSGEELPGKRPRRGRGGSRLSSGRRASAPTLSPHVSRRNSVGYPSPRVPSPMSSSGEEDIKTRRPAFKQAQRRLGAAEDSDSDDERKILKIANWSEVRGLTAFKQKLESVISERVEKKFIVLDNVHYLTPPADPATGGTPMGSRNFQVFDFLLSLSEQLMSVNKISLIVISHRILPNWLSSRVSAVVRFPAYTQKQARDILERQLSGTSAAAVRPEIVKIFLAPFVLFNYAYLRDDFGALSKEAARVFSLVSQLTGEMPELGFKVRSVVVSESNRLKGVFDENSKDEKRKASGLSKISKLLLVASYIAAHNPKSYDNKIFLTVRAKSGRNSLKAFKKAKMNADAVAVRPPSPFAIPRLLVIAEYLAGGVLGQSIGLFQELRGLTQRGFLKKCGTLDWMDGSLKLTCHAPLEVITNVADELNIILDEVLF